MTISGIIRLMSAATLLAGLAIQSPAGAATVEVSGPLSGDIHWTADNEYLLTGYTYVLSGGVLRIDPGTVIRGRNGAAPNFGSLFVTQGGKILAEGTPDKPIIFTAESDDLSDGEDLLVTDRGLWGGIAIFGKARINKAVNAAGDASTPKYEVFEGLEDAVVNGQNVHRFGGSDDEDSSGALRYVSIRHGGQKLSPDKEINGVSLCGVGRGTTIEYVEVVSFADDGFEFFGGSVNTKHLVSAFNDDDGFDTDMGWNGKNQFWFGIQANDKRDNGSEQNGEPNERNDGNGVPASTYEVYNATLIGAGANAGGTANNHGMLLRRYLRASWYNSILTDFNGQPLNGGGPQTGSTPTLVDNVWWGFTSPVFTNDLFTVAANNNATNINPLLRGISRTPNGGLDPRPETAVASTRSAPANGFYSPVAWKGAFDSRDNWLRKWTYLSQAGFLPGGEETVIVGTQAITGDVTWSATNTYLLTNYVYVLNGATLRIEPGTVIKGRNGTAPNFGCLFVCQGGKILAEGTPNNPIIFTAETDDLGDTEDLLVTDRGLWGGIVILGQARINKAVNAAGDAASPKYEVFEGLEDLVINGQNVHRFGGSDDNDSSGVLRYVSVRHGGQKLSPDKEINGVSLGGVGRGTTVEFVEVLSFADDGFEFFGGSVNTRYLISAFNDDDGFDTDMGWNGRNQFWFGIQSNDKRDNGSEQNGEPNERNDGNGVPASTYEVYNATLIGAGANAGGTANNNGMLLRRYLKASWYNSLFTDFNGQPLNGGGPQTGSTPTLKDNIWWGFTTPVFTNDLFTAVDNANATHVNPMLRGISRSPNGGLDPRPSAGSPALTSPRTPPADGFYTAAAWKGAFASGNWASDWSALGQYGILSPNGAINPVEQPAPAAVVPRLVVTRNGALVTVTSDPQPLPAGFVLQLAPSVNGPWLDQAGANTPVTVPIGDEPAVFLRALKR